jgi:hypothetical protein
MEGAPNKIFLNSVLEHFERNTFTRYMLWPVPRPKVILKEAYRIPPGSLNVYQFLDYTLSLSKSLDFSVMKDTTRKFKWFSKYWSRKLTTTHFKKFPLKGHTYYLGQYDTLDCYIVWEPTGNSCDDLNCAAESKYGAVSKPVADLICNEIILKSLEKYFI